MRMWSDPRAVIIAAHCLLCLAAQRVIVAQPNTAVAAAGVTISFQKAGGTADQGVSIAFSTAVSSAIILQSPLSVNLGGGGTTTSANAFVAEPVNTAIGNYYSTHTDLAAPGRSMGFQLVRSYNSLDAYAGPLGPGWTHSYNIFLVQDAQTGRAIIKQGDGSTISFNPLEAGQYAPAIPGLFDSLRQNSDGTFTLTRKNQTTFNFSPSGQLQTIVDHNRNTQRLSYAGSALTNITDTAGRIFSFAYDNNGHLLSVTDPSGRSTRYAYNSSGNLTSFQDAVGVLTQYSYDSVHRMISATDPGGNVYLQNTYDSEGRVVSQKNARNFTTTFAYNTPSQGTTTITDPLGNTTQHVYDSGLRLIAVIDAAGGTTNYTYDANNSKLSATDPLGRNQSFAYDANGNLTSLTDAVGKTSSFSFDPKSNLLTSTDRLGRTTTFTYDPNGNLLTATDPLHNKSTFSYDSQGQVLTATNAAGFMTSFQYDAAGDLTKVTDALGGTVTMGYDTVGRLLGVQNQLGKTATRAYDSGNRLLSVTDPLGNLTQFAYDGNGNLTSTIDANGKHTQYAYDPTNKLVQVTDAIGGITQYQYNGNTDLTTVTDANGHSTTYAYDVMRRLSAVTNPLGSQKRYGYDGVGNVTSTVSGNNKTNVFEYDSLNRLVSMALSDGKSVSYSYDAVGNRMTMADWRGTSSYGYDLLNRVASVTTPDGKTVGYSYDTVGNRATLTYPDGKVVQYVYNPLSRLTKVTDWAGKATTYGYDPAGNLSSLAHPNGANSSYQYDTAGRLINLTNRSGSSILSSFAYALDNVGNRLQMTTSQGGVNRYGYDGLYRLTSWTAPSGQITQWTYDAVGSRLATISPISTTTYSYDAADELLTAGATTYTYDGNGNQITKTGGSTTTRFGWDALDRLISVIGGNLNTQYQYDGDGNRVSQQVPAGTYAYVNDPVANLPVVLNEAGPDGNITYSHGLALISVTSLTFQYYHQFDGLGSTSNLTDATGAQKANYSYDPWGKLTLPLDPTGTKDKYKFTDEAVDPNTILIFLRARYYDPAVGSFLSRDPAGISALLGHSLYEYAVSNPGRFRDPSGRSSIDSYSTPLTTPLSLFQPTNSLQSTSNDLNAQIISHAIGDAAWNAAQGAADIASQKYLGGSGGGTLVSGAQAGFDLKKAADITNSLKNPSDQIAYIDQLWKSGTPAQKAEIESAAGNWDQLSPDDKTNLLLDVETSLGHGFYSGYALPRFGQQFLQ